MFELSGVNYEKVLEQGDSILVRVIASSSYRGFELSGVRVIEGSSYRDYTVTVYVFNFVYFTEDFSEDTIPNTIYIYIYIYIYLFSRK